MMDKKNLRITPIVLAGGKGTRLWPMSRASRPKQFLSLTGDCSLFQQTLKRLNDAKIFNAPIVITNEDYRFIVAEQALEFGIELHSILLEPEARNTAVAICVASMVANNSSKDQLVFVLPSDHVIETDNKYAKAIADAKTSALTGQLVTFGITPSHPATGFGYIEAASKESCGSFKVKNFVEKPKAPRAKEMLESGKFFWNTGMFLFSSSVFLKECEGLAPKVFSAAQNSLKKSKKDMDFIRLDAEAFSKSPDISVDYAIFEKTNLASVVPSAIQWSDLGAWDSVWDAGKRDEKNNLIRGDIHLSKTNNSLVLSDGLPVAVHGMDNIAVIASEDAIYVGDLSKSQDVSEIVRKLRSNEKTRYLTETHQTSYRPWGGYSSVLSGERFQVKRLFVKPGKKLSLQKHHHRSEHWIVVHGTADVQIDEKSIVLRENESVFIPQGAVHRLANPGRILLELIEVQTGSYLGEDDIIRLDDEFGRN